MSGSRRGWRPDRSRRQARPAARARCSRGGPRAAVGGGDGLARAVRTRDEIVGDLLAERRQRRLAREVLDTFSCGRDRDVIDVSHLAELLQDEVAAAVAVEEGGRRALLGECGHRIGHVRSLDRDSVFDAVAQQGEHVRSPLDHDDRVGLGDPRPGRQPLVGGYLPGACALADGFDEFRRAHRGLLERAEQRLRAIDHLAAFGGPDVLDPVDVDGRATRPDPVDGFERCAEDRGLDPVEPARDGDPAERLAVLGVDRHVDPTDLRGVLERPEIEIVAEQALGLAEDRADHVVSLHHPLGGDVRVNQVLRCVLHDCELPRRGVLREPR